MEKKVVCIVLVSVLLLSTMLLTRIQKVEAEGTTVVYVDPPISYATVGQTFSINVSIANVTNLWGYQFILVWNNTLLNCIEAVDTPPAFWDYVLIGPGLEQNYGRYFRGVGVFPPSPQFNGSTVLATLTFQVLDVGECVLNLYGVTLVDGKAEIIEDWYNKDSLDDGYFEYTLLEHDVAAFLDAPGHLIPGDSALLTATVFNGGLNNETDVELQLLINGSIVNSVVIDFLLADSSYTISYLWTTTTIEAVYNVTAYALPVPDEDFTLNNMESATVPVSYVIRVPFHYQTIQEAIDAANLGDTILVSAGTYYEHVTIDKSLTLVGEESSTPIIDGSGTDVIIRVTADNVDISKFTIRNAIEGVFVEVGVKSTSISSNTITNTYGAAIYLNEKSSNNFISDNWISDSVQHSIVLAYLSHNNTISGNRVSNTRSMESIWLICSHNNTISGNTVSNNEDVSILLSGSDNNIVSGNSVSNNEDIGIALDESNNNSLEDNTITNNTDAGIYLDGYRKLANDTVLPPQCYDNSIFGNIVSNNWIGIQAYYTQNNAICHNSFINNTVQVLLGNSSDIWDNGCEGNYWSDYAGEDLDGDGVGDTLLPHQGVDNYPLMSPYMEGDVNHDAIVDIMDGVTIGIAFGAKPSDPNWNPHADLNEDEIIDIADIILWAIHFGETWDWDEMKPRRFS